MAIPVSSSLNPIDPNELLSSQGISTDLAGIVPSETFSSSFYQGTSVVEFHVYSSNLTRLYTNSDFTNYTITNQSPINSSPLKTSPDNPLGGDDFVNEATTSTTNANREMPKPPSVKNTVVPANSLNLTPAEDLYNNSFNAGSYFALYNFINYELLSYSKYFISTISSDRTEIRIKNNTLGNDVIINSFNEFNNRINTGEYIDEFYINFGYNKLYIGINIKLEIEEETGTPAILIKLFDPLDDTVSEFSELSIVTKVAESLAWEVRFEDDYSIVENVDYIKGPNINIPLNDLVNNSTTNKTWRELNQTSSIGASSQLHYLQNRKGVQFQLNYNNFDEFIHYSSAEQRLENFRTKMIEIEGYKEEIGSLLLPLTGATTGSSGYSSSVALLETKIDNVISKFDGYEYFLYFTTGSKSWPKTTDTIYPYPLYSYSSSQAKTWYGSTDEDDPYYSQTSRIYSASLYDEGNTDYLYYVIPPFITDNADNDQYLKFVNMSGQLFDEIWLYTKFLTTVRNNSNALTGSNLPLSLAGNVIESLGMSTYGNDFETKNDHAKQYIFTVPSSGSLSGSSGIEYITDYIDVTNSSGSIINYYNTDQTTLGYLHQMLDTGYPYPMEGTQKEIYKRIFANMVSLVKRKGTVTGLRQLINIWGVPNTMLRISEFGGKNKKHNNDWDLWYNRYSKAYTTYDPNITTVDGKVQPSSSVIIPWRPLTANVYSSGGTESSSLNSNISVPDCIQFRFKTDRNIEPDTHYSESLLIKKYRIQNITDECGGFAIRLERSMSQTASYSGSIKSTTADPYYEYGTLKLLISGSTQEGATPEHLYTSSGIYLPFYNKDWWSVQVQRKTNLSASVNNQLNEFEIFVGQKGYEGNDDNRIKWLGSSSITMPNNIISASMNAAWNRNRTNDNLFLYIPYYSNVILGGLYGTGNGDGGYNIIGNWSASTNNPTYNANLIGDPFSGSFQEFRYYRRAISQSQFFDYVMNPRSIEGLRGNFTGSNSSFDLLSFRIPLGNELEYQSQKIFTPSATSFTTGFTWGIMGNDHLIPFNQPTLPNVSYTSTAARYKGFLGSVHPSSVGYVGPLYTSSFLFYSINQSALTPGTASITSSNYWVLTNFGEKISTSYPNAWSHFTSSNLTPNDEVVYLDQPSAGIRNRNSNKIAVADSESYGEVLSSMRSIYQDYPQNRPYNENTNNLEVGFSFQNEINDEIISAMGHGVISDIVGDADEIYGTAATASYDRYPRLTRIAEDYFNKYSGTGQYQVGIYSTTDPNNPGNPWSYRPKLREQEVDYNRLIQFYETSLFKAIKNYVPARTSLSTGIIIKPHLLERNSVKLASLTSKTTMAITPETGSIDGRFDVPGTPQGFQSPIINQDLTITSSIKVEEFSGGVSDDMFNKLAQNSYIDANEIVNFSKPGLYSNEVYPTSSVHQNPTASVNIPSFYTGSNKIYSGSFLYLQGLGNNIVYQPEYFGSFNSAFLAGFGIDWIGAYWVPLGGRMLDPLNYENTSSVIHQSLYRVKEVVYNQFGEPKLSGSGTFPNTPAGYVGKPIPIAYTNGQISSSTNLYDISAAYTGSITNTSKYPLATNLFLRFKTNFSTGGTISQDISASILLTSSFNRILGRDSYVLPCAAGASPYTYENTFDEFILYPNESFMAVVAASQSAAFAQNFFSGLLLMNNFTHSINFPLEDITDRSIVAHPISASWWRSRSLSMQNYPEKSFHQTWVDNIDTPLGIVPRIQEDEKEFYDGEYSGSTFVAEDGEMNNGCEIKVYKAMDSRYHIEAINYVPKTLYYATMSWVEGTRSAGLDDNNYAPVSDLYPPHTAKYDSWSKATSSFNVPWSGMDSAYPNTFDKGVVIFHHRVSSSYDAGEGNSGQILGHKIDAIHFDWSFFRNEPELFPINTENGSELDNTKPIGITNFFVGSTNPMTWLQYLIYLNDITTTFEGVIEAMRLWATSGLQAKFGCMPDFGIPTNIDPYPSESWFYNNTGSLIPEGSNDTMRSALNYIGAEKWNVPFNLMRELRYGRGEPYFNISLNDKDNVIRNHPSVDSQSYYNPQYRSNYDWDSPSSPSDNNQGAIKHDDQQKLYNYQITNTTLNEYSRGSIIGLKGLARYVMLFGENNPELAGIEAPSIAEYGGNYLLKTPYEGNFGTSTAWPYSSTAMPGFTCPIPPGGYNTHSLGRALIFSQSAGATYLSTDFVSSSQDLRTWTASLASYPTASRGEPSADRTNTIHINSFARAYKSSSAYPVPGVGTASVFFYQPTFSETSSFHRAMPFRIRISYHSATGENMAPTLKQDGNYDVKFLLSMSYYLTDAEAGDNPFQFGYDPLNSKRRNIFDSSITSIYHPETNQIEFKPLAVVDHTTDEFLEYFYGNPESRIFLGAEQWKYGDQWSSSFLFTGSNETAIVFDPYFENAGFYNSDCNPTMNNENENRLNPFLFDVDYSTDLSVPVNLDLINKRSAILAQVPASNYTQRSAINPRYNGCKLLSADYNHFTSKTQGKDVLTFLNGDTGSWEGDKSYGPSAVIDTSPIYIAHFKQAIDSRERFDTMTFNIDSLIEIPDTDIIGKNQQPSIIGVDGSGDKLFNVSSTFPKGRALTINFNEQEKEFSNLNGQIINYSSLQVGTNKIYNPASQFQVIATNQINQYETTPSQAFNAPQWITLEDSILELPPSSQSLDSGYSNLTTGSNMLILKGCPIYLRTRVPMYLGNLGEVDIHGPHLQLLNTLNKNIRMGDMSGSYNRNVTGSSYTHTGSTTYHNTDLGFRSSMFPLYTTANTISGSYGKNLLGWYNKWSVGETFGAFQGYPIFSRFYQNTFTSFIPTYEKEKKGVTWQFNPVLSGVPEYENFQHDMLVEEGDIIRVTYDYLLTASSDNTVETITQDFEVMGYNLVPPILSGSTTVNPGAAFTSNVDFRLEQGSQPWTNPNSRYRGKGTYTGYQYGQECMLTSFGGPNAVGSLSQSSTYRSASFTGYYPDFYGPREDKITLATFGASKLASGAVIGGIGTSDTPGQYQWVLSTNQKLLDSGSISKGTANPTVSSGADFSAIYEATGSNQNTDCAAWASGSIVMHMGNPSTVDIYRDPSQVWIPDPGYIYDRLRVVPDPKTLKKPIPGGAIKNYTIFRRVNADDRVIVEITPPTGSKGIQSPSGDGFLIPNDLTEIQKRNVQTVITQLKSSNAFQ